jgi:hypothetical protein
MAEMDDVLAELRHRIMGRAESGPPKPVPPVEAVAPPQVLHPAMTRPVDLDQWRGSAAVALRRLSHPDRDGGVLVGDDPLSPLIRRLSRDMPELLEEIVALVERRTAELSDDGAAPRPTESLPAAPVRTASALPDDDTGTATISLRLDTWLLAHIDADAKRRGISRTTWLQSAASERLGGDRR